VRWEKVTRFVNARNENLRRADFFKIPPTTENPEFVACAKDQIDSLDRADFIRPELCVASGDNHVRIGRISQHAPDQLTTFTICALRNRTRVQHINIAWFIVANNGVALSKELSADGRGLGEIDLAAECM
jgi:hypothetical protein